MKFTAQSQNDLEPAASYLIKLLKERPVVAFYGAMGVGKTTFIKVICKLLSIRDTVNSPSFAIINEYSTDALDIIYHFDLYRMKTPEELFDIGGDEYFYSGNICLVEWPEKAESFLPENRINVFIEEQSDTSRIIKFELL